MTASLQSRVQLLAILAVAFTLISVPLFYQVRADASESRETAKNSFFSRLFRDMARDMKPPEDIQVEDAWEKWQQEHPECGAACDPDADPDGDGMSNREEVDQGRNPACNEEREGKEYCEGQPPVPPQNATEPLDDLLYEKDTTGGFGEEEFLVKRVVPDYDRWVVTWQVNNYRGFGSNRVVLEDSSGALLCCDREDPPFLATSFDGEQTLEGSRAPPSGASYRVSLDTSQVEGSWRIEIRGIRDAPDA